MTGEEKHSLRLTRLEWNHLSRLETRQRLCLNFVEIVSVDHALISLKAKSGIRGMRRVAKPSVLIASKLRSQGVKKKSLEKIKSSAVHVSQQTEIRHCTVGYQAGLVSCHSLSVYSGES